MNLLLSAAYTHYKYVLTLGTIYTQRKNVILFTIKRYLVTENKS